MRQRHATATGSPPSVGSGLRAAALAARWAAISVALDIAEAAAREGAASKNHFKIARGSAGEVCSALDFCGVQGAEEQQAKLRRIHAMLRRLAR